MGSNEVIYFYEYENSRKRNKYNKIIFHNLNLDLSANIKKYFKDWVLET